VDYSGFDDDTLMRLIAQRRSEALGVLYDRYARLVYSVSYQATSHAELAEEVTQDTFLRVWQRAASFDSRQGRLIPWITRIARNRVIDLYRRQQSRTEGHAAYFEEMPDFDLSDEEQDVEAELETSQQRRRVRAALSQLPSEQRLVLALAYFRGLTHEQIAGQINVPLGTVKTRLRLGMMKLRRFLQAGEDGEIQNSD
jgi:RNA polymerase sigma-70 factor (ECF subfamily)